jgi:polygalacturonase
MIKTKKMKKKKFSIYLFLVLIFTNLNSWSKDYNIVDYGAIGDGSTLNTVAIQSAINACSNSGGGRVIIPSGKYLSGTILLKSNIELYFENSSTLLGSPKKEDYPIQPIPQYRTRKDTQGFCALIYAEGIENISLTGYGKIDGQGQFHKLIQGSPDNRPKNIMLVSCKNIRVEGLNLTNSGMWNQHYLNCEDVIVRNLSVYNHCNYNNDAIDIDGCRRFVLSDCIFDTDDDGITLKSTGLAPTEDVVITNCIVSSFCNAIKAGTESLGGFRNVLISNCIVKPSINQDNPFFSNSSKIGITGLSLMIVDGGTMEGVSVNNLTIYGTMAPLFIRLGNRARRLNPDASKPPVGKVNNISISNIVAYGVGSWGSTITGIPGYPVKNITLNNVQLFMNGGMKQGDFKETVEEAETTYPQPTVWKNLPASGLYIRHAEGISIHNLVLGVEKPDERVPIILDDVSSLQISGCRLVGHEPSAPFVKGRLLKAFDIKKPLGWNGKDEDLIKMSDR